MPFLPLLELALRHPAAAGGALPGAAIVPDAPTRAWIAGRRCRAVPTGERLVLLAETDAGGAPLVTLGLPARLGFGIAPLTPALAAATDAEALAGAPVFTDLRAGSADPQPLRRVAGDPDAAAPGLRIELRLTAAAVAAALGGKVRRCVATLPASAARWCYHLVTDLPAPLADWRIAPAAGLRAPVPSFGAAAVAELAADDPDDPVGAALAALHPGRRVLRFLSDAPVAADAAPVRGLELRVGESRLLAALPAPPPTAPVRIGAVAAVGRTLRVLTA